MANTAQSKKRARQSVARQDVNKARRSRIRTFLRKVEEALASGDQGAAAAALKAAQPEVMRGVTKGVLHYTPKDHWGFGPDARVILTPNGNDWKLVD